MPNLHLEKVQSLLEIKKNIIKLKYMGLFNESIKHTVQSVSLTGSITDLYQLYLQNIIITAIMNAKHVAKLEKEKKT